jgi:hypothetical protein
MITVPAVLGRIRSALARPSAPRRLGLTQREPASRTFGFDRGKPIDRWYIERFLREHSADVRGRVLEVAEDTYTTWYGGGDVTHSDVLYASEGNPVATIVGDLTTGGGIPAGAYDCIVLTQTLPFIFDVAAAVRGTREALAEGGVLLATVPGISQISREDRRDWGDWWRFTTDSVPAHSCTALRPRSSATTTSRLSTPTTSCSSPCAPSGADRVDIVIR